MPKRRNPRRLVGSVSKAIVAAGAAALSGGAPAMAGGASLVSTFLLDACLDRWYGRWKRELLAWWDQVVMEDGSDRAAAAQVRAKIEEDPGAQEVIVAALRALQDRVSPEVVPAFAMLTRKYLREGRGPDGFFRALCRVLSDLTANEYQALEGVIGHATASRPPGDARSYSFVWRHYADASGKDPQLGVEASEAGLTDSWEPVRLSIAPAAAGQVFHLLTANALADRVEPTRSNSLVGMTITGAMARRIAEVLPQPQPAR